MAELRYDGNGNRVHRDPDVAGVADQEFEYVLDSNRISTSSVNGGTAASFGYDGMGNVTNAAAGGVYTYDDGGRLESIYQTATTTGIALAYNGIGELARSRRTSADPCTSATIVLATEYFTFSPDGRALELVSSNNSRVETDWVWLDGMPVAQFDDSYDASGTYIGSTVTYLFADHLGTPRIGTDSSQQITWRYDSDAFGVSQISGTSIVRLRFPGQVDLSSAGQFNYNYFRDYFTWLGRYLESDPIGLDGGLNTYGYVEQNPVRNVDPTGEGPVTAAFCEAFVLTQTVAGFFETVDDVIAGEEVILQQLKRVDRAQESCNTDSAEGMKRYLELELIRRDLKKTLIGGQSRSVGAAVRDTAAIAAAKGLISSGICAALIKAPGP